MPELTLHSIPYSLMMKISKKLWLKEIARLRQTCKEMNNFFSENHLQITADCPHKLEIYPRLSDDGKMDTVTFRTTSVINDNHSMELYDPRRQTEAANFNTIEIAVMKMCYNVDADCAGHCRDKCLKSLLTTVKLSCTRLILTGCVEEQSLWDAVHLLQGFKAVDVKRATVEQIASLPESCSAVDVHTLDIFPPENVLYRFETLKIGCFSEESDGTSTSSLEEEVDVEFDKFMLALRQTRNPGNLRFLQVPCLFESDRGGIRHLDCARFGLTKIYDGERFQKTFKANCLIYLMDFTTEHIPIVIIKETPVHGDFEEVYEVIIIENNTEMLADAIGSILFRDYPMDNSILREGFEGKAWDEYTDNIQRYIDIYSASINVEKED